MPNPYSPVDTQYIIDHFPHVPTTHLCKALNRNYGSVAKKAHSLGLKKTAAYLKTQASGRLTAQSVRGFNTRFKTGGISWNKGKKQQDYMSAQAIKKSSATRFKKGNTPHNIKYNGHERIDTEGYTLIRVSAKKYVLKHRLIWEQANGPIPKSMVLVFKDKNKQNICLENLELITRAELGNRNRITQYPTELQATIKTLNKLKKVLHEKQN